MEKLAVAKPMFSKEPLRIGPAPCTVAVRAKSINVDKATPVELYKALTKQFLFCIFFYINRSASISFGS